MSWRDRVSQTGFFRSVPFFYETVEGEIGRRTSLQEFPGRDQPFVEDLGRRTRRFTIDMFVLGEDYDQARDKLREALEQPGPGELEHPYWGTLTVTVDGGVRIRESTKQGGYAQFSVSFIEAGAELPVLELPDTKEEVAAAAEKVTAAAEDRFAAAYSVASAIAAVVEAAIEAVQAVASMINKVRGKIAAAMQLVNDLKAAVDAFADAATSLILTPVALANAITGLIASVVSAINNISDAFSTLQDFFGVDGEDAVPSVGSAFSSATKVNVLSKAVATLTTFGDDFLVLPETTDQEIQAAENQRQIARLFQIGSAVSIAEAAIEIEFDSFDQAQLVRDQVVSLLDLVLDDDTLEDELYNPLTEFRSVVVDHFNRTANTLPELQDYTPNVTLPALLIAYQIYGDSKREGELMARNPALRDPTAIPGGQSLRVLIDA